MSTVVGTSPSLAVQSAVVACFNALVDAGRPVARTSVTVGITPWDDCCAGQLYGRIDRLFRSDRFPSEGGFQTCARPTAALTVIGLVRCYPSILESASAPPAEDESLASIGLYDDAVIVWEALQEGGWWPDGVVVQAQQFLSLGGCAALETQVYVELV